MTQNKIVQKACRIDQQLYFQGRKIMKRLVVFASVIMLCAFISSSALGSDLKVGTLFEHTGALKDWRNHFQHAAELAAK